MYLQDFVSDKDALLSDAMKHPAMQHKRKPTIETAMKAVVSELEIVVSKAIRADYEAKISDAYDMQVFNDGEYADAEPAERDNWSAAMDEAVETLFEPLAHVLSQDWLARNTIDTRLYEEDGAAKLADSLGREIFKQLAYGKEPGQVLSNAGILRDDVERVYNEHMALSPAERKELAVATSTDRIGDVIAKIFEQVGRDFDVMEVYDDMEQLTDDDEVLSGSAAARLGLDQSEIDVVQMYALEVGVKEAADELVKLLQAYEPGKAQKPPKAPKTASAVPPAPAADIEGTNPALALQLLKAHSAAKEQEMADLIGVSRTTLVNIVKGKNACALNADQHVSLRNRILADVNGMYAALCALDGVSVDRTWE